jgi:hypothetical protein
MRCREVINVDPSPTMVAVFEANAQWAGISNASAIEADWLDVDPPRGSLALVKHVAYLTWDIVPFIKKLEVAATRRVLLTVNSPPPLEWHRGLFERIYDEVEESAPGHVELMNVLWELGIEPDLLMLPLPASIYSVPPTREAAIERGLTAARGDQWAMWPLGDGLETRVRALLEMDFDRLFTRTAEGYVPTWPKFGREVLITWQPRH